jgi:tetratricopeptide (TPR) repeat protein
MRRFIVLLVLLLGIAIFQSVQAPAASAFHGRHWGGGWGHRHFGGWGRWHGGWGHHNWGFGRGYVYRPIYRGWYGHRHFYRGGWGYGGYGYNSFYPTVNYGYYPSYGSTIYYDNCAPVYQTYSNPVYYDTQYNPNALLNYYSGAQNGGVSNQLTAGTVIAQLADNIRTQRAASGNDGRLLSGLGNGGGIGNGRLRGVVQNIVGGMVQNQPVNANTVNVRYSNPDSRSKARAYLTQGDNLFREQRYAAAAQQYRAAASLAPDLAEANWRYSHTLVAMGEFDLAVNAVNRALAASKDTARNGFTLDTLYGDIGTAKASHLERLANQALETDSPNAYFLLGMTLHYSGETARAEKFFAKAAEVTSGPATHIAAFVPAVKKSTPAAPAPSAPALLARLPKST